MNYGALRVMRRKITHFGAFLGGFLFLLASVAGAELLERYSARDTLAPPDDEQADARDCLEQLVWTPEDFQVRWKGVRRDALRTRLVFPSPVPSGDPINDRVIVDWYRPWRESDAEASGESESESRPAVLVVHEAGANMPVGRMFAQAFQAEGFHAFLIHLPYYGERRSGVSYNPAVGLRQAVADVRRARDAIAILPEIAADRIAVHGISLGGFVTATTAAIDPSFHSVFLLLAGGDLYDLLMRGEQDAARMRRQLERAGYQGERLRDLVWPVEPLRLAHRLDPARTWLYTARDDRVVPPENSRALARAAGLEGGHHRELVGDHYTAIVHFARVVREIAERLRAAEAACGAGCFEGRGADRGEDAAADRSASRCGGRG